jgi:hypothetical protein
MAHDPHYVPASDEQNDGAPKPLPWPPNGRLTLPVLPTRSLALVGRQGPAFEPGGEAVSA